MIDFVETPATEVSEANTKKHDVPDIVTYTLSGDIIVMEATSGTSYTKYYYTGKKPGDVLKDPRRVKKVKLPVSQDGKTFHHVDDLFKHLLTGRYQVAKTI